MELERLKQLLKYDPLSGSVYLVKNNRQLLPDQEGGVVIFDKLSDRKINRLKLDRIAYALAFNKFPSQNQKLIHKNLNPNDNRLCNLTVVSNSVYKQIKEAHRNLTTGIKVVPHPDDQFAYYLIWYCGGYERKKVFYDIGLARKEQLKLQLKYSKVLTKYCVFE
jgi:hypothetical protein